MQIADYKQQKTGNKRVRFFDGQFLHAQDFIDEQKYHIDRQQRHNQSLHIAGIVSGLDVQPITGKDEVKVLPGIAIDRDGRQIVWENKPSISMKVESNCWLYIAYHQITAEKQSGNEGALDHTRWQESPCLFLFSKEIGDSYKVSDLLWKSFDDWDKEWTDYSDTQPSLVLLARLTLSGNEVKVDRSKCSYSGLRLHSPSADATLRMDAAGSLNVWMKEADTTPKLTIASSGNVGIGKIDPQKKLDVDGDVQASGDFIGRSFTSSGDVGIGKSLKVSGDIQVAGNFIGRIRIQNKFNDKEDTPPKKFETGVSFDFMNSQIVKLTPSFDSICAMITLAPASSPVMNYHQLSFHNSGIFWRKGLSTEDNKGWSGEWFQLATYKSDGNFLFKSKVGIGIENPTANLHVNGHAIVTGKVAIGSPIDLDKSSSVLHVTGDVEIGTTKVGAKLHMHGELKAEGGNIWTNKNIQTNRGRLIFSQVSDDWTHTIYNNNENNDKEGQWDGLKMNIGQGLNVRVGYSSNNKPSSFSALYIDTNGNVGIGMACKEYKTDETVKIMVDSPTAKLHVNGNASITGQLFYELKFLTVVDTGSSDYLARAVATELKSEFASMKAGQAIHMFITFTKNGFVDRGEFCVGMKTDSNEIKLITIPGTVKRAQLDPFKELSWK